MNAIKPSFTGKALWRRVGQHTAIKALGTTVIMAVFFIGYFTVLRHPIFPVSIVPHTWIDSLVRLQPWTLPTYFSLWLYVSLPASFMTDRRELFGYGFGSAILGALGLACFFFWPTTITNSAVDWTQYPALQFLKQTDSSGNACPSLHVAFAVFSGLWFVRLLPAIGAGRWAKVLNLLWVALIIHSTLATKQHVALDLLFGLILGAQAAAWNFVFCSSRASFNGDQRAMWSAVFIIKIAAILLWTSGIAWEWCLLLFVSGGGLFVFHSLAPNACGVVRVISSFATKRREIWLTLDDGPDSEDTPRILDLLDQHKAKATFFLIGERAARQPELVAEIARRGHEIGHHTQTHPCKDFWFAGPARTEREIADALPALCLDGQRPSCFRSPVGIKPLGLASALKRHRLTCIGWSLRSGDSFAKTPEAVAARVSKKLTPGMILLMHEGPPVAPNVRVNAISQVLAALSAQGYRCVIPAPASLR